MTAVIWPFPPRDALAALEARGKRLDPSFDWRDVDAALHAQAFTVAKTTGFDVLGDIYAAVRDMIAEGRSVRSAIEDLEPILVAKGWWGRKPMVDPQTGEVRLVQLGSPRRLQTIFNVNMRVSYAAGHWAGFERTRSTRPFLRYVAVLDRRTRPAHAARHNVVLPIDHPWWDSWAPPCGWNCRCTLQALSERDVGKLGDKAVRTPPPDTFRDWTNPRTGEVQRLPDGIDPGWGHNPGRNGYRAGIGDKLIDAPPALARAAIDDPVLGEAVRAEAEAFVAAIARETAAGGAAPARKAVTAAVLPGPAIAALEEAGGAVSSAALQLGQTAVRAMLQTLAPAGAGVSADLLAAALPAGLAAPRAVLVDLADKSLVYVVPSPTGDLAVRIAAGRAASGRPGAGEPRQPARVASIEAADLAGLADPARFRVVSGGL